MDGGLGSEPGETSGSRIKARHTTTTATGADGATQTTTYFAGWFDTMRNESCAVGVASDGMTRCLPAGAAVLPYYADAACTQALIVVSTGVPVTCGTPPVPAVPKYIADTVTVGGCSGTRLRATSGNSVTPTNYYVKSGATCVSLGAVPAGYVWADGNPGAEIPPTDFVAFTVATQTL